MKKCKKCEQELPPESFKKERRASDGLTSQCRECINKQKRQYYHSHKEEDNARSKRYNLEHKQEIAAKRKQYWSLHRDDLLAKKKQYYASNKEKIYERQKAYNQMNRKKVAEYQKRYAAARRTQLLEYWKQYYRKNRERRLEYQRRYWKQYSQTLHGKLSRRASVVNRRARKRSAQGSHTPKELQEQLARQKHRCYYCNAKLGEKRNSYHADHIVPLSKGGTNYIDNIVLTCPTCNLKKGDKLLHEWLGAGRLL